LKIVPTPWAFQTNELGDHAVPTIVWVRDARIYPATFDQQKRFGVSRGVRERVLLYRVVPLFPTILNRLGHKFAVDRTGHRFQAMQIRSTITRWI